MRTNLEILLGDWGRWKAIQDDAGLGYPSEAAFSKMRVDCNVYSDSPSSMVDPDVRKVDGLIAMMHPVDIGVLVAHYKGEGPVKAKHDRLGLSRRDYYYHLDSCHRFLSVNMGGRYWVEPKLCAHVA